MIVKNRFLIGVALAAIGYNSAAYAQDNSQESSANANTDNVIVVTANKREQNLNDVGLTITAIGGDELTNRGIVSLEDVASVVPGLAFASSTNSTPIFTLRGVGFNESSLGVYPAVSVYSDQIPLPFPVTASHAAYDLERVEVLKGPQGTLFGQNATGGAINYIAAKPTDYFEAGGDISYGRFNSIGGNAFVSGPLGDNLKGRLAFTGLNSDDWQRSNSRPNDTNGSQSYFAGRMLLDFEPTDRIRLSLNLNGWRDRSDPQAQQLVAVDPQIPPPGAAPSIYTNLANTRLSPTNSRAADWSTGSGEPRGDRRFLQASLRADIDVTDDITLTSLTSYNDYKQNNTFDGDGSPLVLFDIVQGDGTIKSFGQELRLANNDSGPFRWVVGANYEDSNTFEDQILNYQESSNFNAANAFINSSGITNDQSIENYALFANGEFEVSDQLTFKAGARYTESTNNADICSYAAGDGNVAVLFNILGGLLGSAPFTPIAGTNNPAGTNNCYTLNANLVPGDRFVRQLKEDNISWRVGLDFKANDDILLYTNISRGYKAGSYPSLAAATFTALAPVTQESVTAFEGGFKATLADDVVQWNGAAFYYDYKDKQVRGKILDPIFGILDALQNVPKSKIFGLETDLTIRPVDGLTISGSVTFLDSEIQNFSGVNVRGVVNNFSGDALPFTPKWSYGLNVDYKMETANGGTPFVGVSLGGRSSSDSVPGGSRIPFSTGPNARSLAGVPLIYKLEGYTTVDARLGYEAEDESWRIMVWGKNIFNEYYLTNTITSSDSVARFAGRPATYGITIGFKTR
ncbi:hypothetical protein A8B75_18030 [Sphingomonadales bacterium EhC05]|nr:hypothetical protein A8B75_18030 [Sphingomonadales bacterium EhC05]